MSQPTAVRILDREFLTMRCKVLDLAAAIDRIGRGQGDIAQDHRMELLRQALDLLADRNLKEKAQGIQMLFSLPYDANWKKTFAHAQA